MRQFICLFALCLWAGCQAKTGNRKSQHKNKDIDLDDISVKQMQPQNYNDISLKQMQPKNYDIILNQIEPRKYDAIIKDKLDSKEFEKFQKRIKSNNAFRVVMAQEKKSGNIFKRRGLGGFDDGNIFQPRHGKMMKLIKPGNYQVNPGAGAVFTNQGYPSYPQFGKKTDKWTFTASDPASKITIICSNSFFWSRKRACKRVGFIFTDGSSTKTRFCGRYSRIGRKSTTGFLSFTVFSKILFTFRLFKCEVHASIPDKTTTPVPPNPITTVTSGPTQNTTNFTTNVFSGVALCSNPLCGKVNQDRIVGGQVTEENEYPWQAGLVRSSNTNHIFCGATIVNDRYLVTAAHCVTGKSASHVKVKVGQHAMNGVNEALEVKKITIHENYNSVTEENDIAILELAKPMELKDIVMPVCAPEAGEDYTGQKATATGWGTLSEGGNQPNLLHEVELDIVSNSDCAASYGISIKNTMICAGETGKDTCQGDSGGPLVVNDNGNYNLVGVVSWGIGCGRPNYYGVYTRVTEYLDWINGKVADGGHLCSES